MMLKQGRKDLCRYSYVPIFPDMYDEEDPKAVNFLIKQKYGDKIEIRFQQKKKWMTFRIDF